MAVYTGGVLAGKTLTQISAGANQAARAGVQLDRGLVGLFVAVGI